MKPILLALVITLAIASTPRVKADEASRTQAAEELLKVMGVADMFSNTVDQILDAQIKQNPQMAELKDVMKAFFEKYMSWDSLKGDITKLYADAFTEEEIGDIIKFYQTPTGQKLAKNGGALAVKSSAIGQEKVQAHIGELQQMIQDAMAKKGAK